MPAHWHWHNSNGIVITIAFVVDEVGVPGGVSLVLGGEWGRWGWAYWVVGPVLSSFLSAPSPLSSPPSSPPSLVSLHEVGQLVGCALWWWRWKLQAASCDAVTPVSPWTHKYSRTCEFLTHSSESPSGWNPRGSRYGIVNLKYPWVQIWVTHECTRVQPYGV